MAGIFSLELDSSLFLLLCISQDLSPKPKFMHMIVDICDKVFSVRICRY
jgi:hypothetical protein